ncbi:PAS domain-containing sensor histidine kinase [Bacillus sp. V59.32b]|uniref:PAS domain-containing sensor histidine kinase n=1 Tax=Bacillus sp. V59.32b TaxID=1758642 RepID=UPI000E3BC9BD|nr:PAS domain-containing sensor histidine kinase [Bacillus sp. V59.32b]RFU69931.1 two-component sensor histidine kinase [Bacillus sp. V59.32b]
MFKNKQNIILYISVVVLPLLIFCYIYFIQLEKKTSTSLKEKAEWVGSIHHQSLDQVIRETKNNLEILALSGTSLQDDEQKMEDLLSRASNKDPRYAGMYWLNTEGYAITGTNEILIDTRLMDQPNIETVLHTKKPVVSDKLVNEQETFNYFSITAPILDTENNVNGFVMAQIRIDYMENVMSILTPDYTVSVENKENKSILEINPDNKQAENNNSVIIPFDEVSWHLHVKMDPEMKMFDYKSLISGLIYAVIVAHVLFLIVKYLLLSRATKRQKKLIDAQKLEVVGTLAASTAHEIKNPLTGIKGLIQLLEEKYTDEKDQLYFSVIMKEIERINGIVSEFIVLGKPTAQKLATIDIRTALNDLQPLLESEANLYNVSLTVLLPENPVFTIGSSDQIKQVILNIAKNGFEAMPDGGDLMIELSHQPGKGIITITDTGYGMTEENLKNVFDPFYSSKESGTGLGLYVCRRIVEQFHGSIHLSSKKNQGTRAVISIPTANEE